MLFVAMVTSLLTACSQSETVTTYEKEAVKQKTVSNGPIPIDFNTYTPERATTRTENTDITPAYLANQGFSVFAYHTGSKNFPGTNNGNNEADTAIPNLMYNQQVTGVIGANNNVAWRYFPLKYWPQEGDHVSFFAYGTYASATQNSTDNTKKAKALSSGIIGISGNGYNGVPYLLYDLGEEADASEMRDLLIATPVYTTAAQDVINFSFTRFMSAIGFKVSAVYDSSSSTVKAIDANSFIRIEEIKAEVELPRGRVKIYLDPTTETVSGESLSEDDTSAFEDGTGAASQAANQNFAYTLTADDINDNLKYKALTSQTIANEMQTQGVGRADDWPYTPDNTLKLPVQDTHGADQLFYFMPISDEGRTNKTFTITVKYHVFTKDPRMKYGLSDSAIEVTKQQRVTLTNAVGSLLWFNLQLGLDAISISVDVNNRDWYLGTEDSKNVSN